MRPVPALLALALLLATLPAALAIDVAIPSDFPDWEVTDNDQTNQGYYWSSSGIPTANWANARPYSYQFDARGNLVWYWTTVSQRWTDDNATYYNDYFNQGLRDAQQQYQIEVYHRDGSHLMTIENDNPFEDNMNVQWHGTMVMDGGTSYSIWSQYDIVDMTYIGGEPDCEIRHNVVEQRDADGNQLWRWDSQDHIDQLPYEAQGLDAITGSSFSHMHMNSMQVLPDGDILCNGRSLNTIFRIDRATGNLEWTLGTWNEGGMQNSFTFTTNLDLPDDFPLEFTRGHDAWLLDNNTTLYYFDNGTHHDVPDAYARVYELNYDTMTAELTFVYDHPEQFASPVTGGHRPTFDGNHIIGWGGGRGTNPSNRPPVNATEVDNDGNVIWEIALEYGVHEELTPKTFRWNKFETFIPQVQPYISHVDHYPSDQIEIVCNWFGHEDAIDAYDVYMGFHEDNMMLAGNTDTGIMMFDDIVALQPYFFAARPVDADGNPVGPMSNMIHIQWENQSGVDVTPLATVVPASGGTVLYATSVTNAGPTYLGGLTFQTEVMLPNGNVVGPILQQGFNLFPLQQINVSGMMLAVPGFAPMGDYTFTANVWDNGCVLWSDGFGFSKLDNATTAAFGPSEWAHQGDLSDFEATLVASAASVELPASYELRQAYPNPFNPTTTVSVALPAAADLNVAVYNVTGQLVATLANGVYQAGQHNLSFDASGLASGLYFVRATVPGQLNATQKVMLVR